MALYRSSDYQTSFESTDFQDGDPLGFPVRMVLATFDLQVTAILPMKILVNWPFGLG